MYGIVYIIHVTVARVYSNLTRSCELLTLLERVIPFLLLRRQLRGKESNMNGMKQIMFNLTALTSVGMGGWYLGKLSEHRRCWKNNETSVLSARQIRNMPGLPLFGTVSAATPLTPAESDHDMGSKLSSTIARVSQVGENQISAQG